MQKRCFVASLLTFLFVTSVSFGQGTSLLTYRLGVPTNQTDAAGLSEYRIRLPGLQFEWNPRMAARTAFGYHHADFGSDLRFWGGQPMDAFLLEGSFTYQSNPKLSMVIGSSFRIARIARDRTDGPVLFHNTGMQFRRHRKTGSFLSFGLAWRNGVGLPVIPLLGYDGVLLPGVEASILLPGRAHVWKTLGDTRRLGGFARYETTPYPGPVGMDVTEGVLRERMIRTGLSLEQKVGGPFWVRIDLAATLLHDRKVVVDGEKLELDTDPFWVLDLALIHRPVVR